MLFKRFRKRRPRHFDVSVESHRVISLRKRTIRVEVSREGFASAFRLFKRGLLLAVPILAVIILAVTAGYSWHANADVVLSPTSCLGAWEGSTNAAGPPDVLGQSDDEYTFQNSATISDALAQIFCGGFTGAHPEGTAPTALSLTFSFAYKILPPGQAPVQVTNENFASSTNAIIDAPAGSELLIPVTSSPDVTPGASDAPASPEQPPPSAPATSDGPQAFRLPALFERLLATPHAHAQESATSTPVPAPNDSFAEVFYTLDGANWISLGTVSWDNVRAATFTIPLDQVHTWQDLDHFQVSIRTLSGIDAQHRLYLDGMQLAAAYAATPPPSTLLVNGTVYALHDLPQVVVHPRFND